MQWQTKTNDSSMQDQSKLEKLKPTYYKSRQKQTDTTLADPIKSKP